MASRWDYRLGPHDLADGGMPGLVLMPPGLRQATIAGLESRKDKNDWMTDHPIAAERICALQWEIAMNEASNEISLRLDRLYRLLDSSINGTVYSSVSNPAVYGGYSVAPAIPPAPFVVNSSRDRDNERYQQLDDVIETVRAIRDGANSESLDEIIAQLASIVAAL